MATNEKTGLYWGNGAIYFAAVKDKNLVQSFHTAIPSSEEFDDDSAAESLIGSQITESIRKSLIQHRITSKQLAFSIPTKDVIFRSFVIPFMQAAEVKNVVEFEATKYIPFKLDDLYYTYHPITIVEKERKSIRILFIGAKKDRLEKYFSIFEHSELKVETIEPAYMSLVRCLTHKKLLKKDSVSAIIEIQSNEGTILIVDQNIPQFVREFQLYPKNENPSRLSSDILRARLFNEAKISFDYYSRQRDQQHVQEIIALTNSKNDEIFQNLGADFGLSTKLIAINQMLGTQTSTEVGYANSYGVCLKPHVLPNVKFSLPRSSDGESADSLSAEALDFKLLGSVALACLLITFLVFNFTSRMLKTYTEKIAVLNQQLGPYASLTAENIDSQTTNTEKKVTALNNIHLNSQISYYLKSIPEMLPAGTWLDNIYIEYSEILNEQKEVALKLNINLSGNAYKEDVNQQFGLVNDLMSNLKGNKEFIKEFEEVNLDSVQTTTISDYTVTTFKISCR